MHGKSDDFAINMIHNQNTKEPKVTWERWSHTSLSVVGTFFVSNAVKHSPRNMGKCWLFNDIHSIY